jgi:hypothetical protein
MGAIEDLDDFDAGFLAGWYAARGIEGRPTPRQLSEALAAYARFAARPQVAQPASPAHPSHL